MYVFYYYWPRLVANFNDTIESTALVMHITTMFDEPTQRKLSQLKLFNQSWVESVSGNKKKKI